STRAVAEPARGGLAKRGVTVTQLAQLTLVLQKDYDPAVALEECEQDGEAVLRKREVQSALLTGIQLDMLAEEGKLMQPLLSIVRNDEGLYGCDEVLALSIVNVYGSIALPNLGYLDKIKPGIMKRLNNKKGDEVHTFLDDIVGAIAAAAASRMAHNHADGDKD